MCDPVTLAVTALALTTLSAGASVYGQQQQKKMQEEANQKQHDSSMTAYRHNLANIEVQRNQMAADATQQVNGNNAASRAAQGHAQVAAGEAGVSGLSVDALLQDIAAEAGFDNTSVEENYLRNNTALNARRENVFNSTVSDINSLKPSMSPDYLGAGLRIAQAGTSSYGQVKRADAIKSGDRTGGGW